MWTHHLYAALPDMCLFLVSTNLSSGKFSRKVVSFSHSGCGSSTKPAFLATACDERLMGSIDSFYCLSAYVQPWLALNIQIKKKRETIYLLSL